MGYPQQVKGELRTPVLIRDAVSAGLRSQQLNNSFLSVVSWVFGQTSFGFC